MEETSEIIPVAGVEIGPEQWRLATEVVHPVVRVMVEKLPPSGERAWARQICKMIDEKRTRSDLREADRRALAVVEGLWTEMEADLRS